MSRIVLLFTAAVALTFSTTGCLRSATTVLVHKDGSATITDTTLFSPRFLAMMKSLDEGFRGEGAQGQEQEETKIWSDSTLAEDALDFGPNVKLDSWSEVTIDGMVGYVAIYAAPNVNTIILDGDRGTQKAKTEKDNSGMEPVEEEPKDPWRLSYVDGVLRISNPPDMEAEMATPVEQEDRQEQTEEELRQTIDMMAGFMRDMKISLAVAVDGEIEETNALHRDGNRVILVSMDFDKMVDTWQKDPKTFRHFDKMKEDGDVKSVQEMLDQYPEGALQIETQPEVTIRF